MISILTHIFQILEEFDRMHPNKERNHMTSKFLAVMPKILGLSAKRDIELNLNDGKFLYIHICSNIFEF